MNKTTWFRGIGCTLILLAAIALRAATVINSNTEINPLNLGYDGQDIVISNCTVTVDGAHTFSSLVIETNGILTHTGSTNNGEELFGISVTNDPIVLSGTTPSPLFTNFLAAIFVTDQSQTIVYTNGVDYLESTQAYGSNFVTEIARTASSSIPDGATVLVSFSYAGGGPAGLDLAVTGMVWVAEGGEILADGLGYGGGFGPGTGASSSGTFFDGSGGGDGGIGGMSLSNAVGGVCYDSLYQPSVLGSGGGASYAGKGGTGGGLVQIMAGGNVEIDGLISANGQTATNSRAGGGSGGGIYISALSVSGSGTITANGGWGTPDGGGGGGGRIAIACNTNNFAGTITAFGGGGANYGGAGTIFTKLANMPGLLTLNNNGNPGANSTITLSKAADLSVSNGAVVALSGLFLPVNLTVGTNGLLTAAPQTTPQFTVSNLTVMAGGAVSVNGFSTATAYGGRGITATSGSIIYGGGGGYGGYGGPGAFSDASGGFSYGYQNLPPGYEEPGSPGGGQNNATGGAGGGWIRITVEGFLQNNGSISANGANGLNVADGGGSGGGVYLTATTLSGNGTITANGGAGANSLGGGGSGGRIVVGALTNLFSGLISCYGGPGANYGGAGTIFLEAGNYAQLILDNGGNFGQPTPVTSATVGLIVQNGAWGTLPGGTATFANITVNPTGFLAPTPVDSPGLANVTVLTNMTIQAGGAVSFDSWGYIQNETSTGQGGTGSIPNFGSIGGGGGNGGMGGAAFGNVAAGGVGGYNSLSAPQTPGGAGGGGASFPAPGGPGGGALELTVDGILQVNGSLSANGGNGLSVGGGGGAGGALELSAATISGSGSIAVNGGNGADGLGGGGGGGCIALTFGTNLFVGTMSAYGGSGANDGGAGTIYYKTNSSVNAELVLDNGAQVGGLSELSSTLSAQTDLTVRNNSMLNFNTAQTVRLGNLVVSNASIVVTNEGVLYMSARNITVQAGGAIIGDAGGYPAIQGPDAGRQFGGLPYQGGGGGNAGCGGMAISNSAAGGPGGNVNPFPFSPTPEPGSGGGGLTQYSTGGTGGAIIDLSASTITVNGRISANGGNGTGTGGGGGGGGAGGSVVLNPGQFFFGSGVVSANGGNGANGIGGGGGGGAVIINFGADPFFTTNLFTGTLSAYGGLGATNGGAGIIYNSSQNTNPPVLVMDNGGNIGTNTPFQYSSQTTVVVRNGAKVAISGNFLGLLITSNAWVVGGPPQTQTGAAYLTLNSNLIVQAGGGIIVDSQGSPQNAGNGRGLSAPVSPLYPCGGAGDAGYGGAGISNGPTGGPGYGGLPALNNAPYGSGGGGYSPYSIGGAGGGGISLSLGGNLQVDGVISANGGNGTGIGGGGGSGGSIYISANSILGAGSIMANGGNGANGIGGGGGGGCISIACTTKFPTNVFAGTVSAYGGGGANDGGAGFILYQTNTLVTPLLLLDNNNNPGTNTYLDGLIITPTVNVTVQRGAVGQLPFENVHPGNVLISSNSAMTERFSAQTTLSAQNLTVAAGGALTVDGRGNGAQSGSGAGSSIGGVSGGGGHGGYGGGSANSGGAAYDSIQAPAAVGSGGANSASGSGGIAGGSLTLEVISNLVVNGRLSANGLAGGVNAGGGAGGSLYFFMNGTAFGNSVLSGNGIISANGGAGSGSAGGGGGGRISLLLFSNNFAGQIVAAGGAGASAGGAGTIYMNVNGGQTLAVKNAGIAGTNTPLSSAFALPSTPFELDISGGASVVPLTPLPVLSNLNVFANSTLTLPVAQSALFIGVMSNATISGDLTVDDLGYSKNNGPGAGSSIASEGSGGGYGGAGGASASGASGGIIYGSATAPTDFGSGGGSGANTATNGSWGGGALRLSVLGTLTVNGNISANGDPGLQDNSGGGSGGGVWITAGTLSGAGTISAAGGNGVLSGGGGGGGGRIAIDTSNNQFTGTTNVSGGTGAAAGQVGTVTLASALTGLQVVSLSPTGGVMSTVSSVNLTFSDMLNAGSVSTSDFTIVTPSGGLSQNSVSVSMPNPFSVQLSFPTQSAPGTYTVTATTAISDIAGAPLSQAFSGTFTISSPVISGTITGTNGAGAADVSVQASGGVSAVTTDSNGNYALSVPPSWTGTVTPSLGANVFVPPSISYTNISGPFTNQNYVAAQTISPAMTTGFSAGKFSLNWTGISGVTYQALWSTNLMTWQLLGSALAGTNGPMQVVAPSGSNAAEFFQIQATP